VTPEPMVYRLRHVVGRRVHDLEDVVVGVGGVVHGDLGEGQFSPSTMPLVDFSSIKAAVSVTHIIGCCW
jgi:hypothetical protein